VEENKVTLRDLGSSNGTFLNEKKVSEATLKAGDRVKIGPVYFTVQIDGIPEEIAAAAAPPQPSAPPAPAEAPTTTGPSAEDTDEFDIDELGELDIDDLSDLDLDVLDTGESDEIEEIDDLEEIDESDLLPDDDSGDTVKS
jgi:hypothetical protein